MRGKQIIDDLSCLSDYDQICLTGGEVMLYPQKLIKLIEQIKEINPSAKIFIYTALCPTPPYLTQILYLVDGIHYSLRANTTDVDIDNFSIFQVAIRLFKYSGKTFRLFIHPECQYSIILHPNLWYRVELKHWISDDACELPTNESLLQLSDNIFNKL
jgi:pyruvate-formate lyase-activating enzyme